MHTGGVVDEITHHKHGNHYAQLTNFLVTTLSAEHSSAVHLQHKLLHGNRCAIHLLQSLKHMENVNFSLSVMISSRIFYFTFWKPIIKCRRLLTQRYQ